MTLARYFHLSQGAADRGIGLVDARSVANHPRLPRRRRGRRSPLHLRQRRLAPPPAPRDHGRRRRPDRLRRRRLARRLRRPGRPHASRSARPRVVRRRPALPQPGRRHLRGRHRAVRASRPSPGGYGHGVAVGDYDNDGRPTSSSPAGGPTPCTATGATAPSRTSPTRAGLGGDRDWPTSAAFADLDGDGDLDLYVCHYLDWDPATARPRAPIRATRGRTIYCGPRTFNAMPDHVFRNDGGRFVDVSGRRASRRPTATAAGWAWSPPTSTTTAGSTSTWPTT